MQTSRQKINKDVEDLNNTINQFALADIYRTFHQQQQNTYSFQKHVEESPRETICWVMKQSL